MRAAWDGTSFGEFRDDRDRIPSIKTKFLDDFNIKNKQISTK